jgi:O-antigen ligase
MAFFGILQWLANPQGIYGVRQTPHAIPFSSFVNQHHFAAFMEMTIGLTLALLLGKVTGKDKRLLLMIAIILMGIAIILTGSRGGLLSLLGVLAFVYTANYLREKSDESNDTTETQAAFRRKLTFIGSGAALLLLICGAVLFLGGDSSLLRGVGVTNQEDFSSGRIHFWTVAIQIFKDYPIFGAGLDAFGTAFPFYDTWNGNLRVEQAHNDYLQILADAGLSGFLCVAAFICLLFKRGIEIIQREKSRYRRSIAIGSLAGCFGILIHSFFDFPLRTPSNAFYFLLFTVLATTNVSFPRHLPRKSAR